MRADGSVRVEIEGAVAGKTYRVWLVQAWPGWTWITIGYIYTDDEGDGELTMDLWDVGITGTMVTSPFFAVNPTVGYDSEFVSGFVAP